MIKGISEIRRIPRLGKIRLGIKKKTAQGIEYPSEVDYFILDPEVPDQKRRDALIEQFRELYGDKPKSIKIMFPPASPELFFAQWYKRYSSGALLKCRGDGETAETMPEFAAGLEKIGETERGFIQVVCRGPECPYQTGNNEFCKKGHECGRMASLQVILPELKSIGVFQINTGSFNSIVAINSAIEWIKGLCGRYAMVPLTLMRQEQVIAYEGKKSKHYILAIDQNISIGDIQKFAMLTPVERALIPAPDEKKDELFYDANGKKPDSPAPEEEKVPEIAPDRHDLAGGSTTTTAVGRTFNDDPAEPIPGSSTDLFSKDKGPMASAFDEDQKLRAQVSDLKEGIQTCKTRKAVKEYCDEMREKGYIAKLTPSLKAEFQAWINTYLKGLKT